MYNYKKLINKIKNDLYKIILLCILLTLIAINFIIKDLFLIIVWCILVAILLSSRIIRFIKFRCNVLLPMKKILNKELEQNIIEYSGCLFTENYIINKTAYWIISYDDILLMNKQLSTEGGPNGGGLCTRLYMVTKNGNYSFILYSPISYESNHKLSEKVYQHIKNKNPNILKGNIKENKKILEKQYNIKLPKNWKSQAEDNE